MSALKDRNVKFKHYQPKRWHPEFDLIVYASFAGEKNVDIAKKFGYTPQHISNILSTPQAEEIRTKLRNRIDIEGERSIANRMQSISDKALDKMEKFMNNDELFEKSPFAFVDRAMRATQITGASNEKNDPKFQVNINNQTNVLGNDVIDRIANALELSNQANLLHSGLDPLKQIKLEGDNSKVKV